MAYKVSKGNYENGHFRVANRLTEVDSEILEGVFARLDKCLLKLELSHESSSDNSDDERASDYYSSYDYETYWEIDARNNTKYLLMFEGEIRGVAFYVTPKSGSEVRKYAFFFDGSVAQPMCLGYSASHSTNYTTLNRLTLVEKGVNGAPEEGRYARFDPHEMYPSF